MNQVKRLVPWPALLLLLLALPAVSVLGQDTPSDEVPQAEETQTEPQQAEQPETEIEVDWSALPKCSDTEVSIEAPKFANIGDRVKLRAVLSGPGTFGGVTRWRLTDHNGGIVATVEKQEIEHAYDRSGGHMVRLLILVQGPDGQMCKAGAHFTVRVKFVQAFQFDLEAECDEAIAGHEFTCRASFPGDVTQTVCQWHFVPGEDPVTGKEVQFIFDTPGTYTVFLQAKQLNSDCIPMGVCVDSLSVKIPVQPSDPE